MNDIDTFAEWFDESSREAHSRASQTDQPSLRVWREVSAHLPQTTHASVSEQVRHEGKPSVDIAFPTPTSKRSPGITAWMTVAAVVVMVASGFYLYTLRPDSNESQIAWAPPVGSPVSTPAAVTTCTVTPLTVDEVMATLRNPAQAYSRFGYDNREEAPGNIYLEVPVMGSSNWMPSSPLSPVSDAQLEAELVAFGQMFWNCLTEGTFGQVWTMLDPVLLQWSILSQFPVVRSEESLLAFVEQWISTPYHQFMSDGTNVYTLPPAYAGRTVEVITTGDHPLLVSEIDEIANSPTRYASITMLTTNPADLVHHFILHVSQQPDGRWTVDAIETQQKAQNRG